MNGMGRQGGNGIMVTTPLLPVAAGLIIGVTLDRFAALSPHFYVLALVGATAPVLVRRLRRSIGVILVLAAGACAGGLLHWSTSRTTPASSIERFTDPDGRIARLRGRVVSEPNLPQRPENPFAQWTYWTDRTAFLLAVESIEGVDGPIVATGKVRVTILEPVLDLCIGESVELFGRLYSLRPPANPGSFDWESYHRRRGVVGQLTCKHRENARRLDAEPPGAFDDPVIWLRTTTRSLLTDDLAAGVDEEASLLEAMVLGQRSRLARRLNETFIAAGCIHFLAVSGVHLAIVMFFVGAVCRLFAAGRRTCIWIMIVAVVLYALLAEPRPPILRAAIIALTYCTARLLGRDRSHLNWISLAAIILTVLSPTAPFDVGFQLSFAAVLGVGYLAPALRHGGHAARLLCERWVMRRPFAESDRGLVSSWHDPRYSRGVIRRGWRRFRRYLAQGVYITGAAWLAALPVVATHFHQIHPWGALNSLVLLPLVSAAMGLGFAKIILGAISPTLGVAAGDLLGAIDSLLLGVVDRMAAFPGASMPAARPPWWVLAAYSMLLLAFVLRFRQANFTAPGLPPRLQTRAGPPKPRNLVLGAVALAFIVSVVVCHWPAEPTHRLAVTVLSVGRATATVIELPDGQTVLYDAGTSHASDVGRNVIVPFLRHRGIRRIDRLYISHPNLDHFSGVPTILEEIDTGPIFVNRYFEPNSGTGSPGRRLLDLLAAMGHDLRLLDGAATRWEFGGATFEVLSPLGELDDSLSANDTSIVLRVSYANRSVLLTGDVEARSQQALLDRGDVRADLLLLPHHGSVRPTTRSFVEAVGAEMIIRSSGERMNQAASELAEIIGATSFYNTADIGAVRAVIDRRGLRAFASGSTRSR